MLCYSYHQDRRTILATQRTSQSNRIVIDIIGTNDVRYISREVKYAFQQNKDLKEILLLKGNRVIKINKQDATSKRYENKFKKIWNKQK